VVREEQGRARAGLRKKEETFASRNAMGTVPFMLAGARSDIKSTFRKNPGWWGIKAGLFEGNVDEIVYTTIRSDATRMSALAPGDIDAVLDPPLQDIEKLQRDSRIRIWREPENLVSSSAWTSRATSSSTPT
jgi:peptide/nickel transport system substrate-binding protein